MVRDLYVFRSFLGPSEANPELVIDPDGMLPGSILAQRLKSVSGRRTQIVQVNRGVKIGQLSAGDFHDIRWKAFWAFALIDRLRHPILETPDHERVYHSMIHDASDMYLDVIR